MNRKYIGEGGARELVTMVHDNADNIAALAEISEGLSAAKADRTELDTAYERTWQIGSYSELQALVRTGRHLTKLRYGDIIVVSVSGSSLSEWRFMVRGKDEDKPSNPDFTHSLTLKLIEPIFRSEEGFGREALSLFPEGLAAGVYQVELPGFDTIYSDCSYLYFRITEDLAAAGVRYIALDIKNGTIQGFETAPGQTVSSLVESIKVRPETVEIIPLGVADGSEDGLNIFSRALLGGGEYSHSDLRSWLNSSASAEERAASYGAADKTEFALEPAVYDKGFLAYLEPDFLAVLGAVDKTTIEYHTDGSTFAVTNEEKAFLESYSEITGHSPLVETTSGQMVSEGDKYGFYNEFPPVMTDSDGNAVTELLRTTHPNDLVPLRFAYETKAAQGADKNTYLFPCVCIV